MRRAPLGRGAGAVALIAILGCGAPAAWVEVRLTALHARPAEVRETWSVRFRSARDKALLPIVRASARLEAPGLVLEATLRVPTCDDAVAEAMRAAVVDLATARHRLAIHRVHAERAELLANRLRDALGVDVHTPVAVPGQVVVAAGLERIRGGLADLDGVVVESTGDALTTLWVVQPVPALDGRALATAGADIGPDTNAIELTFTDPGSVAMRALSEATRGQHLVMLLDDRFVLAPRVMERVSHSLRLELPPAHGAESTRALARALAASNIDEPPTLVSAEARCAAPR